MIHKTLGVLQALTELGLIQKAMLQEFLHEVVPFLAHPVSNHSHSILSGSYLKVNDTNFTRPYSGLLHDQYIQLVFLLRMSCYFFLIRVTFFVYFAVMIMI